MIVGVGKAKLYLPTCHSLKEKRSVLRKLKDRTFNRFKIQVSEVGNHDFWQTALVGFSLVGNKHTKVQSLVDRVFDFLNDFHEVQIEDQSSEIIHY